VSHVDSEYLSTNLGALVPVADELSTSSRPS
jgi:hypothetical protein